MLCSLCLKNKTKFIQLPCNHNICFACIPRQNTLQKDFKYQCETCLQVHHIKIAENMVKQEKMYRQRSQNSVCYSNRQQTTQNECIFCWTCHEAISINQYIKGRHHDHSVQTYQQAIPSIKNVLLQQRRRSIGLKEYLEERKQFLENGSHRKTFQNLVDKINQFFSKQVDIIQRKRDKVLEQIQACFARTMKDINKNIDTINPVIDEIQNIQNRISTFLADKSPFTQINPISQIIGTIDSYTQKLKQNKLIIAEIPQFIVKSNVKQSIDGTYAICFNKKTHNQNNVDKSTHKKTYSHQVEFDKSHISLKKQSKFINFKQPFQQLLRNDNHQGGINRKVKLLQKVKGKMKYTSQICSTTFS